VWSFSSRLRPRAVAALAASWLAAPGSAAALEFLHVEANEGGSSGGHAALRFGDATFHFQNAAGLLVLAREDSRRFLTDYALLQNRPIHVLRIEVGPEAERSALEGLQARLAAQRSQLDALSAQRAERELLDLLARRARGGRIEERAGLAIPGAGYFAAEGPLDPALAALRERALAERGAGFFEARRRELRAEIARLEPELDPERPPRVAPDVALAARYGFGARYADLAAGLVAVEVLSGARALRSDATRSADDPALALDADERRALRAFADALRERCLRLLDGSRPEWGRALLVGMARLAALEPSLGDGRLRVLDAFAEGAPELGRAEFARQKDLLPLAAEESRQTLREALRSFVARRASQAAWSDLEDVANRHLELLGAWRKGRALRVQPERLVPARPARLREPAPVRASPAELLRAREAAERRERELARAIDRVHGYHLVERNCVSELLAVLDASLDRAPRSGSGVAFRLRSALAFVPFVSAAHLEQRFGVRDGFAIPSLRRARLARLRAEEGSLRVLLRESSPLTARSGRRGARDSFFLFYTDHVFWPRPILGALNLAAGAGELALGLLLAPTDGGRTLLRGVHGALMSLPELAFVNLRKGTNDWVPESAWQELGLAAGASDPRLR
jgi:hypothetical protein